MSYNFIRIYSNTPQMSYQCSISGIIFQKEVFFKMQVIAKQKTYSLDFRGAKLLIYNNYKKRTYIQNIIKNIHSYFLK